MYSKIMFHIQSALKHERNASDLIDNFKDTLFNSPFWFFEVLPEFSESFPLKGVLIFNHLSSCTVIYF